MNSKIGWVAFTGSLLLTVLFSCGSDNDNPTCDVFSSKDSVCYCTKNPENGNCIDFKVSLYTEEEAVLTPHNSNGTIWCKGFVIDNSIYIIDRQSDSPHAFWKFDVEENDTWESMAPFPGTRYGLTGAANGKGYASSYASNKFWEYDPIDNQWTPLDDLPFSPAETHWVEYKGKYYVPHFNGVYEFNPEASEDEDKWVKVSNEASDGYGAVYLIGDIMYWYNINNDTYNTYNLENKSFGEGNLPLYFGSSVVFNSPFVIGDNAFVVSGQELWKFDSGSKQWNVSELAQGRSNPDDVFVIDGVPYLIENGSIKVFEKAD